MQQLTPYLGAAAEPFWHELTSFAASHLNMAAHDAAVRYEAPAPVRQPPAPVQQPPAAVQQPRRRRREREESAGGEQRRDERRRRRTRSRSADDGGRWPMYGAEHAAPPPRALRNG